MAKSFRNFILLLAGLLAVSTLVGCGGDDDSDPGMDEPVPANFVSAVPPGGEIAANGSITVTFDNPPVDVTVSHGVVTVASKTATIAGPFTPGPLPLTITWADGTQTLDFTVTAPCCEALTIVGGTVKDGDTDVDPEGINSDGIIVIEFNKDVSGKIVLQTEDGADVGWIGKVEGDKGTLELIKGRELTTETVYVIFCKISDVEGHTMEVEVTFVTKGKV